MRPETTVDIPADWLVQQPHLPDRCTRHGLPAVRRVGFAVRSRPIASRRRVLPGYSSVDSASDHPRRVRVVEVSGWPLCAACERQRTLATALATALIVGGLLMIVAASVAGIVAARAPLPVVAAFAAGLVAVLLAPLVLRWGGLQQVTRAQATADGAAVRLTDPHPAFTTRLSLVT